MASFHLPTVCAVVCLAFAAAACNRQESPPTPPKSLATSQGMHTPDIERSDDSAPSGSPGAATDSPRAGMEETAPRGMSGVAGAAAGPVAGADRAFLAEAANTSQAEVEAARLVEVRTDNHTVKSVAQQMERDHAAIGDELKRMASEKGVELPNTIGGEPRGQLNRLTTLSKSEVDSAFLQDFGVEAHRKAISLFERQAREGQDPDLKAFAERTLPKLREQLALAQQMQGGQAGVSGAAR